MRPPAARTSRPHNFISMKQGSCERSQLPFHFVLLNRRPGIFCDARPSDCRQTSAAEVRHAWGDCEGGIHLVKDTKSPNSRLRILPNMILEIYPMKTQRSFFEQNGGTYSRVGDVLLPNLVIENAEQRPLGKYGLKRKRY
ncbi:MAG: TnpV protein, partial [Oscillospiraceae bacterium]|nr:TnpV protein [Oscillospiraceae bacterium]